MGDRKKKRKSSSDKKSKKHKSRKRSRSESVSSSSSSSSSASEGDDRRRNRRGSSSRQHDRRGRSSSPEDDRKRRRRRVEDKKLRKKQMKEQETAEEKRLRRLKKKQDKADTFFGYTDSENPFGDSSLSKQFVWKKKFEKEGRRTADVSRKELRRRRQEKLDEIAKVKARRVQREEEQMEMERLRDEEQRLREAQQYGDWQQHEEEFHLKQEKHRSTIRIKEGRERPIDVIAKNLLIYHEHMYGTEIGPDGKPIASLGGHINMEVNEPYKVFDGLPLDELLALQTEIQGHRKLEEEQKRHGKSLAFWDALLVVADAYISMEKERHDHSRRVVHQNVDNDVKAMLHGKSKPELEELEAQVKERLANGGQGLDYDYWGHVQRKLKLEVAKAKLDEIHKDILMYGLDMISQEKGRLNAAAAAASSSSPSQSGKEAQPADDGGAGSFSPPLEGASDAGDDDDNQGGGFSPVLEEDEEEDDEVDIKVVDEAEDRLEREKQRLAILERQRVQRLQQQREQQQANASSRKEEYDLEEGEAVFGAKEEVMLRTSNYAWGDKYRPRKPRYFNRVKTGYDWNKYNQTHYDQDNPPPKVVQGYKFNIFYPDLLDKTRAPTFKLEKADSQDFCIIRFHAGPPYEDIAFKIVNQEWETSRRSGFKSSFEKGNLHLYFNFKRHRYRR